MPLYRFLVIRMHESAPNDDRYQYSTFYLDGSGADLENLNLAVAGLFALNHDDTQRYSQIESRVFDMADGPSADPLHVNYAPMGFFGPLCAPQEMAICLHYMAGANTPRRRGRLYVTDWPVFAIHEAPALDLLNSTMALGAGLAALGGAAYTWVQYSRADAVATPVTRYWVNGHWSYLRSRKDEQYVVLQADV